MIANCFPLIDAFEAMMERLVSVLSLCVSGGHSLEDGSHERMVVRALQGIWRFHNLIGLMQSFQGDMKASGSPLNLSQLKNGITSDLAALTGRASRADKNVVRASSNMPSLS